MELIHAITPNGLFPNCSAARLLTFDHQPDSRGSTKIGTCAFACAHDCVMHKLRRAFSPHKHTKRPNVISARHQPTRVRHRRKANCAKQFLINLLGCNSMNITILRLLMYIYFPFAKVHCGQTRTFFFQFLNHINCVVVIK